MSSLSLCNIRHLKSFNPRVLVASVVEISPMVKENRFTKNKSNECIFDIFYHFHLKNTITLNMNNNIP